MRKMLVLTSFAAGYVAGAAAGRERYELIRSIVLGVAHDPTVQRLADEAADFAHVRRAADDRERPTVEDIETSLRL